MNHFVYSLMENSTIEANKRRHTIRAIIGSESIDRDGTIIIPHGVDFDAFKKTGAPVLWAHGQDLVRGETPIGNCVGIELGRVKGRSVLVADTEFLGDEFSSKLFDAYAARKLSGWSVNVVSKDKSPPTWKELRARPELRSCKTVYRETELVHYSAVATPSNTDATTIEIIRSLGTPVATRRDSVHSGAVTPDRLLAQTNARLDRSFERGLVRLERILMEAGYGGSLR